MSSNIKEELIQNYSVIGSILNNCDTLMETVECGQCPMQSRCQSYLDGKIIDYRCSALMLRSLLDGGAFKL